MAGKPGKDTNSCPHTRKNISQRKIYTYPSLHLDPGVFPARVSGRRLRELAFGVEVGPGVRLHIALVCYSVIVVPVVETNGNSVWHMHILGEKCQCSLVVTWRIET